ncbi:MAG: DUF2459 domain-containing protein, partial [Hymenobacteraceae bacterium]|nr:DUF2459 domain-containing protein [Hymenobacteraceae bacterium]MDX5394904.1 DUF2459 domain-containing protein [Hymenobacteraceae bacterium]MDX5443210.1 DUF2459 domain-containing protein [Hymenobacteraceae bacterium]MDX5510939.1 DUF2459 domain-containing protein [Hymenobacteraceae bacterium]
KTVYLLCVLLLLAGVVSCVLPARLQSSQSCPEPQNFFWVVNHGYHTSFVVPSAAFNTEWKQQLPLTESNFLEFAWGDSGYYMAENASVKDAAKALFVPSASVMHVVALDQEPEHYFKDLEIKKVYVCGQEYEKLLQYLYTSFYYTLTEQPLFLQPGLYGNSAFFRANRPYHLFFTCNNWTSKGLRQARLVTPIWSPFSKPVMWYLPDEGR